jgi:hypothetical protein
MMTTTGLTVTVPSVKMSDEEGRPTNYLGLIIFIAMLG